MKVGVALNFGTSIEYLKPVIDEVDLISVTSVNPGYVGQSFIESHLDKIRDFVCITCPSLRNVTLNQNRFSCIMMILCVTSLPSESIQLFELNSLIKRNDRTKIHMIETNAA